MSPLDVERHLASLAPGPVHFFSARGNAGDALIVQAAVTLFERLALDYQFVDPATFDAAGKTVVITGSGGIVPPYTNVPAFLARVHATAARVLVLPSTIRGHEALLGALGRNVEVICREVVTLAHVRAHAPRLGGLYRAHDLAFGLDARALLARRPRLRGRFLAVHLLDRLARRPSSVSPLRPLRAEWIARTRRAGADLHCFRLDAERTGAPIPADNIDVAALFEYGTADAETAAWSAYRLVHFLDQARTIHTNRLHVAIAGALLGKQVRFHANSYDKCAAVYEESMRGRYPNVVWMGADGPGTARR